MLRSLKDLEGYTVSATDGDLGSVVNFLFDDERWIVRYLVVETGKFFEGRHVLISPISFRQVDGSTRQFHVALTKDKVKNSPGVETPADPSEKPSKDIHLRSARDIRGYHIQGSDEEIGHIADFIIDDETWEVRYLVIDTSNWWVGKKVLVAPHWASRINWEQSKVHVALSRETIKNSPEWNPAAAVNREYEARLYDYYGRPAYWAAALIPPEASPANHHVGSHLQSER